jgi:hypothetical protein
MRSRADTSAAPYGGGVPRLAGTLLAVALAAACNNGNPAALAGHEQPDQILIGVRHMMTVDGVAHARVDADSAYLFDDRKILQLHGVTGSLLEPPYASAITTLKAPYGEVDLRENTLRAHGGVEATSATTATTVLADELIVGARSGEVASTGRATVRQGGAERQVDGFRGDFHLRQR